MPTYAKSLAPNPIPLANLGRFPLYRIKIPPDFLDLLVAATLGNRYVVLSVIGRGGMSVVYKAKEMGTGLIVAVKTLRTHSLTDEMVVKRFQREAELLSRLNHPRIVNLHAYGTSSRGQPYFVMDYLVGDNLVTVLKREDHLDAERFQDIFVQVCAAIEHAHKHGAIHRDIKPGNIMLTRTKHTKDYVKVVDFGIAKLAEEAQKLTRMGEVWGSPIYMSPEQCMGAAIDARSDIYSLGIVMYECLTGRVPFLGRNYADTMGKQISEPPPTFAKIRPELTIPASLETIVMTALAKDADNRYQSLTQMRKDLEAAFSTHSSGAITVPPKTGRSTSKNHSVSQELQVSRAPSNKMKAVATPSDSQNKSVRSQNNLKSQTISDIEKPRKSSGTRSRMDAAVLNPNRARNLILIAGGSLIFTASLITVFTHGAEVATFAASFIKQVVGGTAEEQSPAGGENTAAATAEGTAEKDPQKALQDWLTPSGGAPTTGNTPGQPGPGPSDGSQPGQQGTTQDTTQGQPPDSSGATAPDAASEQDQMRAAEDQKQQEQERQDQERQNQERQDQERLRSDDRQQ